MFFLSPEVYREAAAAVEGQQFWIDRIRSGLLEDQGNIPIVGCTLETRVKASYEDLLNDANVIATQIQETVNWLRDMAEQAENHLGSVATYWTEMDEWNSLSVEVQATRQPPVEPTVSFTTRAGTPMTRVEATPMNRVAGTPSPGRA